MLANKLALVTGAGSGIGQAIVHKFAKQGASIVLVDVSRSVEEVAQGLKEKFAELSISGHTCDVSDSKQIDKLFQEIGKAHPNALPNVLVNSAGITRDAFFLKMNEKDFDDVISINLKGTYLMAQAFSRNLVQGFKAAKFEDPVRSSYGSIVNLASVVGKCGNIGQTNYAGSKAGVEGMTKTIAKELGRYKIRCNAILPGFIKTPMTEKVPAKNLAQIQQLIPLGRVGLPEEIADLAAFLASDSSSYVTGASIECTGGPLF